MPIKTLLMGTKILHRFCPLEFFHYTQGLLSISKSISDIDKNRYNTFRKSKLLMFGNDFQNLY
jgi:hypothetical protein